MALTVFCGKPASVPQARHTNASSNAGEFVSAAETSPKHKAQPAAKPRRVLPAGAQLPARHELHSDAAAPCSEEQAGFNHFSLASVRATGQLENAPAYLTL